MDSLGWNDPIDRGVNVAYRRKGERQEHGFYGFVFVLDTNTIDQGQPAMTAVAKDELTLVDGTLDLTNVPVVGVGGKRKWQPSRVRDFLKKNHGFQGAFLLYPGSGSWDLGEGAIFVTSREILSGKRVSGGKPEEGLTNHRWTRDGKYLADRAVMLHGKVLKTLESELEQVPGVDLLVAAWKRGKPFEHRLYEEIGQTETTVRTLEYRRVLLSGERPRDARELVVDKLGEKLRAAGVQKVADISDDLSITVEDVVPGLVAEAETLGTIEVPGLGRRLPSRVQNRVYGTSLTLTLTNEDVANVLAWPFSDVYPVIEEGTDGQSYETGFGTLRDIVEGPEAKRWLALKKDLTQRWIYCRRIFHKETPTRAPWDK